MKVIECPLPGLKIIEPTVFKDKRGHFLETFNSCRYKDAGINCQFVQSNESFSGYGTIRGIHLQYGENAQAKLVRVVKGKVLDVAVDLRPDSPTFGQHYSIVLDDSSHKQFFIPRGFGHGFSVLSEDAIFSYMCDNFYAPNAEGGIIFNDAKLNIDWMVKEHEWKVSDKDLSLPSLDTFIEKRKLL